MIFFFHIILEEIMATGSMKRIRKPTIPKSDAPLVIHQAVASCGCTVPEYTKEPIQPGKKGTIKVTYNGTGKYPGHFKKSITLRTNAKTEMMRLYIEGNMTAKDAK